MNHVQSCAIFNFFFIVIFIYNCCRFFTTKFNEAHASALSISFIISTIKSPTCFVFLIRKSFRNKCTVTSIFSKFWHYKIKYKQNTMYSDVNCFQLANSSKHLTLKGYNLFPISFWINYALVINKDRVVSIKYWSSD